MLGKCVGVAGAVFCLRRGVEEIFVVSGLGVAGVSILARRDI